MSQTNNYAHCFVNEQRFAVRYLILPKENTENYRKAKNIDIQIGVQARLFRCNLVHNLHTKRELKIFSMPNFTSNSILSKFHHTNGSISNENACPSSHPYSNPFPTFGYKYFYCSHKHLFLLCDENKFICNSL